MKFERSRVISDSPPFPKSAEKLLKIELPNVPKNSLVEETDKYIFAFHDSKLQVHDRFGKEIATLKNVTDFTVYKNRIVYWRETISNPETKKIEIREIKDNEGKYVATWTIKKDFKNYIVYPAGLVTLNGVELSLRNHNGGLIWRINIDKKLSFRHRDIAQMFKRHGLIAFITSRSFIGISESSDYIEPETGEVICDYEKRRISAYHKDYIFRASEHVLSVSKKNGSRRA